MEFLYLIFYAFLWHKFLDVETNPGPRIPFPDVCRILYSNVLGLARNLSDLAVASFQYDILLCSETLVSDMRHVSELLVPGFGRRFVVVIPRTSQGKMPCAEARCCAKARCLGPEGWLHTYVMVTEHFASPNLSVVNAKRCFLGFVVWDRTFMCWVFTATIN